MPEVVEKQLSTDSACTIVAPFTPISESLQPDQINLSNSSSRNITDNAPIKSIQPICNSCIKQWMFLLTKKLSLQKKLLSGQDHEDEVKHLNIDNMPYTTKSTTIHIKLYFKQIRLSWKSYRVNSSYWLNLI